MTNRTLLLAIDTATRFAGLALYDGELIRSEAYWRSQNNHSVELMPALVRMLEQQKASAENLAAVGVTIGPGSFTGLRIGLSVAKGLAHVQDIPVIGVPTLDILAAEHAEQRRPIWAVIQAGRGRVCAARYERRRDRWQQRGGVRLTTLEGLSRLIVDRCLVCGELRRREIDYLSEHVDDNVLFAAPAQSMRRPACLAQLAWQRFKRGEVDDLAMLSPIYIHTSHT